MIGNLYIDGKDAYSEYGVFITDGGYGGLLKFSPLKNIEENSWAEEDGVEVDLSNPTLDTRELSISFAAHGEMRMENFFKLLSDKAYHIFDFREIKREYKLRLVSQPDLRLAKQLKVFSLQFANDFPLYSSEAKAPLSDIFPTTGYELDGVDLSTYGIYVLQGSDAEVQKSSAIKKALLQNLGGKHGATYDDSSMFFEPKDVTIQCLMRANLLEEFWQNYDALLHKLIEPGIHNLYVESTEYEYDCYYKSSSVSRFAPVGKIWFEFSITFVFTSFSIRGDDYLLASEDDALIALENNSNNYINTEEILWE